MPALEVDTGAIAMLHLADWRRRVADLYAEVRVLAASNPVAAWERWRRERETLYREHPQSPLPAARRPAFRACHFPYDAAYRYEVQVEPDAGADAGAPLPASEGSAGDVPAARSFRRIGWVRVPLPAGARRLGVYWHQSYAGGLFLAFRDATNGFQTYGGGRYLLDAAKSADLGGDAVRGTLVLDFNFAYQPSCAFDPKWTCPLAPPENRLDVTVPAGERIA